MDSILSAIPGEHSSWKKGPRISRDIDDVGSSDGSLMTERAFAENHHRRFGP
jgi:hypothetical protein